MVSQNFFYYLFSGEALPDPIRTHYRRVPREQSKVIFFIKLKNFSLDKMDLKKSSVKCQLFCAGFNVLKRVILIVFWWLCAIRQYYSSLALSHRFMNVGNILNFLKWEKVNNWTHWTHSHIKLDCFDYNIKWGATNWWKMQHDEIPIFYMQPTVCVFHTAVSDGSILTNHYL